MYLNMQKYANQQIPNVGFMPVPNGAQLSSGNGLVGNVKNVNWSPPPGMVGGCNFVPYLQGWGQNNLVNTGI